MAMEIAEIIAKYKIKVIYGGGNLGLMGKIARTLIKLKTEVIGIIPKFLIKDEEANIKITHLKIVPNMSKRKENLFKLGDAFLILPGGTGTLEELIEVLSWKNLKLHNKPIIFYNFDNYWSPLIKQIDKIIENKFGNKNLQNKFQVIRSTKEFNKILQSWTK